MDESLPVKPMLVRSLLLSPPLLLTGRGDKGLGSGVDWGLTTPGEPEKMDEEMRNVVISRRM
jgi:hypothetical protein